MEKYLDKNSVLRLLQGIKTQIDKSKTSVLDTKGAANGIASLDAGGNVPLSQLGNLDTTFFEVVTELPTDIRNIKKHIYILNGNKDGENNKYAEYIYTGDMTDAGNFDATKWEKLGDFVPTFDLQEYVKKNVAVAKLKFYDPVWNDAWDGDDDQPSKTAIRIEFADGSHQYLVVPEASAPTNMPSSNSELSDSEKSKPFISPGSAGFMSPSDKGKLDNIDLNALTASINAANTAANNTNTAIQAAENATTGAEKVDATPTEGNVFEVTDRTGVKKKLDMSGLVSAQSDVARIRESMGAYSDRPDITIVAKETNKAISADGVKVTKAGWAIAEFTAELGNIYLFNPGETSSDVCVFAEYIDKVETRAIDYTYTYDESGRVLTAKAAYNGKIYTYTYDYSTDEAVITDQDNNKVSSLPSVYTTTVGAYNPMTILNADAELPQDGYCRFVSNFTTASSIKIVVSYKIDSANLSMKVVRDGSTANMCSQLAKINKKVDDVSAKLPKMWVEIRSKKSFVIVIDGKDILLEPYKSYTFKDIKSFSLKSTLPDGSPSPSPQCIYLCDFHFNETVPMIALPKPIYYKWADVPSAVWANIGITTLNLKGFTFENVNDLSNFCWIMNKLKHINIENVDTSKVTNMSSFLSGTAITEIDLSGLDTSKVTNMSNFLAGTAITEIDLSGLDTSKVTNMSSFLSLSRVKKINLSGVNTQSVTTMSGFLKYCSIQSLTVGEDFGRMKDSVGTLDFSNFTQWKDNSVKSLLALYDRKANGMGVITLKLHKDTKAVLGEDGIAQLTEKGYIIA